MEVFLTDQEDTKVAVKQLQLIGRDCSILEANMPDILQAMLEDQEYAHLCFFNFIYPNDWLYFFFIPN
jgi:hypothetical protein